MLEVKGWGWRVLEVRSPRGGGCVEGWRSRVHQVGGRRCVGLEVEDQDWVR